MVAAGGRQAFKSKQELWWTQPHMFSLIALFLLSTLGLVMLTGRHLDAVPSLQRRPHPRATRLRLRSALEQDDLRQAGFWEAEKTVPRGGGNQRPLNISEADWPAERSQQEHEASTSRKPLHRPWNTDVARSAEKLNVHLVCHSHHDPGWLKTYDQGFLGTRNDFHAHVGPHVSAVQYELDGIIHGLIANPDRKFVYCEMSYFTRWWDMQEAGTQDRVRALIRNKQLQFAGGGWVSNDEAICSYEDIIDQLTLGHRWLAKTFEGYIVRTGWQIDTFGHSSINAALYALSGMDSMFFSRLDTEDVQLRKQHKQLEFMWRGTQSYGDWADIWTYAFGSGTYYMPEGYSLGKLEPFASHQEHIVDDALSTEPSNVKVRVDDFVQKVLPLGEVVRGNDIMLTMGGDFDWNNAFIWFRNLDKLLHHVNKDGRVNVFYSTPGEFAEAKKAYNISWPLQTGDMFPYADCPRCYWTGYYTTRPSTKLYSRVASGYLRAARQLEAVHGALPAGPSTQRLSRTVALMQHHDAITGTDRFHVNQDYRKLLASGIEDAQQLISQHVDQLLFETADQGLDPPISDSRQVHHCNLLNISVCQPSVEWSASGAAFHVVLYNSLAWEHTDLIRIPITGAHIYSLTVIGPDGGTTPSQIISVSDSTKRVLQSHAMDAGLKADTHWAGDHELLFFAQVPPAGYATYHIKPAEEPEEDPEQADCVDEQAICAKWASDGECGRNPEFMHLECSRSCAKCAAAGKRSGAATAAESNACTASSTVSGSMRCHIDEDFRDDITYYNLTTSVFNNYTNTTDVVITTHNVTSTVLDRSRILISNGVIELTYDNDLERTILSSIRHLATGITTELSADMVYYVGGRHPQQPPWVVRPSGQYVFHPLHAADIVQQLNQTQDVIPMHVEVLIGPLLSELRQTFDDNTQLTTRLLQGSSVLEMEWTVGPLSDGRDVCVRVDSNLTSGDVFWTDANGMQLMRRLRDKRSTFVTSQLDEDTANPIGGNYYPITSSAFIEDPVSGAQLIMVTDRGQGASSLASGQLEVMLNRRAQASDELGNPEMLNEAEGCCGVIARGTHKLILAHDSIAAARSRQLHAHRMAWPLLLVFAQDTAPTAVDRNEVNGSVPAALPSPLPQRPLYSALLKGRGLPPDVHLLSLHDDGEGVLILRLVNTCQFEGQCSGQSPAKVDIAKLFSSLDIVAMREMSLTATHPAPERSWPNRDWRAGDPFFNIPDSLRSNPNETWSVPDGFAANGTWLGLEPHDVKPSDLRRRPAAFPSAEIPPFDINDSSRRGWFGTRLVVELVAQEIRTFELLVERRRMAIANSRHWLIRP